MCGIVGPEMPQCFFWMMVLCCDATSVLEKFDGKHQRLDPHNLSVQLYFLVFQASEVLI